MLCLLGLLAPVVCHPAVPSGGWSPAPDAPGLLRPAARSRLVLLTAEWCHWCHVFEADVLRTAPVRSAIDETARGLVADVDRQPAWLDLPGVAGLPTLALFDRRGRLVWLRSGALSAEALMALLRVSDTGRDLAAGSTIPWPTWTPSPGEARRQIRRFEHAIFLRINDHDGGFGTPARRPHPDLLWALVRWHAAGGPDRALRWVDLTLSSALRGSSPRLGGRRGTDPALAANALQAASVDLALGGVRWPAQARSLTGIDPFRGLRDPVEHGLYRYAAGPGWYHPHFERLAADNLVWIAVARRRGRHPDADAIARFVRRTLLRPDGTIAAHQRSDPFYARMTAVERRAVRSPAVTALRTMADQARAALVWPHACAPLIEAFDGRWPGTVWSDPTASAAPPDAVGHMLRALASCPGGRAAARALADIAVARWRAGALPGPWAPSRLNPLVDGICAASAEHCGAALAAAVRIPFDVRHPPPLAALEAWARRDAASPADGGP